MLPLHEAIPAASRRLDPPTFRRWKRSLAVEMARLARGLHDRGYFHKDLYLCHFYIAEDDTGRLPAWRGRVFLIDLHRLGRHRWTRPWWLAKDLGQLLYSSDVVGVTDRDRLWFWRAYRGGRPARWLAAWARARAWSYRRHNARRRKRAG
jgi:heptose I phosphotransferase